MADIAVIGLGAMGRPMARNLAAAGRDVQTWNRSGSSSVTLAEIDAPVVFTALPDIPELREVLDAGLPDALSARPDTRLVVMSTSSPVAVRELAAELPGTVVIDAPMSGGDLGAQAGTLTLFVGCPAGEFPPLQEVFAPIAGSVTRFGELGSGSVAKLANQIVVGATMAALAEAVVLAERNGLDPSILLDALEGGLADSAVLRTKGPRMIRRDYAPGGRARYQLKDLDLALDAARRSGIELPVTAEVAALYTAFVDAGGGDLDHIAIVEELRAQRPLPA